MLQVAIKKLHPSAIVPSYAKDICPTVTVEYKYENILNGYFEDKWREPFRKWFIYVFDIPVKTIDN